MNPKKKRGRPPKYVNGSNDKPIVGLSYDKNTNQYYATHGSPRVYFGSDHKSAIYKFRQWQAEQDGEKSTTAHKLDYQKSIKTKLGFEVDVDLLNRLKKGGIKNLEEIFDRVKIKETDVSDSFVLARTRELLLENQVETSNKMGLPGLAHVDLMDAKEQITLKEIGEVYFDQPKFTSVLSENQKSELHKVKITWEKFCKVVEVETIRELSKEVIRKYYDVIYKQYQKEDKSTTWIRGYFERVIRVVNNGFNYSENVRDLEDTKNRLKAILKKPKTETKNPPKLISKDDFHKLLKVSDVEEMSLWLLSMNGAYYTEDIINLPISAINYQERTIVFRRGKNKEHRSCALWDNTIEAMQKYNKMLSQNRKTFFISKRYMASYSKTTISAKFRDCKARAGIKTTISHSNFRDCTPSICKMAKVYVPSIDAVMGHKPKGEMGKYEDPEIYPHLAEEACKAIEEYYFGKK